MRIRRTHGVFGGFLVALLGAWGAIVPFVGPLFDYAYTPDKAWTYTTGRLELEILPGAGAFLGGLLIMWAASRHLSLFGSLLAVASGAWLVLGNVLSPLWTVAGRAGGPASAGVHMRILEEIGFFYGTGLVIVLIAAAVAGRITAVPSVSAVSDVDDGVTPAAPTAEIPTRREPVEDEGRRHFWRSSREVPASREPADQTSETEIIR
jgi:hypothetical protein